MPTLTPASASAEVVVAPELAPTSPDAVEGLAAAGGPDSPAGRVRGRSEWRRAWRRFKRFKPGIAGLVFITFLVVLAVFAPLVAPYSPEEANARLRGDPPSREYLLGNDLIG